MTQNQQETPTVFIVDDDPAIRFAMQALMDSVNLDHEIYGSGDEFLEKMTDQRPGCLVLDIRMPGLGGLELQEELIRRGNTLPIIFITGHGDVPMTARAMKSGAEDFLEKPPEAGELLDAVRRALERDRLARIERAELAELGPRLGSLTDRERQVFELVVQGLLNKQIAYALNISEKTVKVHRGRVMEKLGIDSVAELVRLCEKAGIESAQVSDI